LSRIVTWAVKSNFLLVSLIAVSMYAGSPSIPRELSAVGRWKTIDDHSGKLRGFVRIYERDGEFFGRVEASLNPLDAAERCDRCSDDRKDQPVIGMELIRHLKKAGAGEYISGEILDPDSGIVYRCKMKLLDDGRTSRCLVARRSGIASEEYRLLARATTEPRPSGSVRITLVS
jgi:uncharacterized protein (DUF2147 family)